MVNIRSVLKVNGHVIRNCPQAWVFSLFDGDAALALTFLRVLYSLNSLLTRHRLRTELNNLKINSTDTLDSYKDNIDFMNAKYQSLNNLVGFGDEELISTLMYGLD